MYIIGQEEINALARVIESRKLFKINDGAREVENFEKEIKAFMKTDYALLMTSGFAAIQSALIGLGIGPGDEVIVPGYTYIATAIAVTAVGAIPVICEVDETLTIDAEDMEKKVSKATKAVIPVHIQGFPSDMDKICAVAKKHGFAVVEDACQSVGGEYKGRKLGAIGDAGTYSFNYFKVITSGEGGALFTNNRQLYERALIFHDSSAIAFFGSQLDGVNEPQFCGTEYRVSEFHGAILREQLKRLDPIIAGLRSSRRRLIEAIAHKMEIAPSHDTCGDCGTTVALRFGSEKEARAFSARFGGGTLPIDTGKHVYTNWTPVMEKRGALHPLMDPFKMEANKNLNHNYTRDMCPKTLDLLSRTVYIGTAPDWSDETVENLAKRIIG
ncbi:MAG: DegT/DnrJ/EryC1/StrS family aminotransferase [Clostridiales bacterium]|nr:DegT/DnrJ/EryC1/StrS family aminotransferase [Clostridiales bacterium]